MVPSNIHVSIAAFRNIGLSDSYNSTRKRKNRISQPPVNSFQKGHSFQMTRIIPSLMQGVPILVCSFMGNWITSIWNVAWRAWRQSKSKWWIWPGWVGTTLRWLDTKSPFWILLRLVIQCGSLEVIF